MKCEIRLNSSGRPFLTIDFSDTVSNDAEGDLERFFIDEFYLNGGDLYTTTFMDLNKSQMTRSIVLTPYKKNKIESKSE